MTKEMNNLFNYISTRLIVLRRIFDNFTKLKTSMESHSLEIIYTDLQNYYCIFDNLAIRGNSDVELAIQIIKAIMSVSIIHPTNIGIEIIEKFLHYTQEQIQYMETIQDLLSNIEEKFYE